ncbi:MAG: methyltransferase domain-containing protein [Candidatus Jordarchaeaceae archaeon]
MSLSKYIYCFRYLEKFLSEIPEDILFSSATLSMFKNNPRLATNIMLFIDTHLKGSRDALLDLGCGYGYLTVLFRNTLGFKSAYGVDIDEKRLKVAENLGVITYHLDLEKDLLAFPENYFNLVIAAGILNHLKFWDNILREANRVLEPGGLLFISNPNMGWWIERISLLLGYQPPSVEVSEIYTVNLPPFYPRKKPIGYIHSMTLRGMVCLLSLYNFRCLKVFPAGIPKIDLDLKRPPVPRFLKYIIRAVDSVLSLSPSLSIRSLIVCEKSSSPTRV